MLPFLCDPWPVWLTLGSWATRPSKPNSPTLLFLCSPLPHSLLRKKTPIEFLAVLFSYNSAFSTFSPSSLFLDEVRQKFSSFCLLWDLEIDFHGRVTPSPLPPLPSPGGTGAAGVTRECADQKLCPGSSRCYTTLGAQLHMLTSESPLWCNKVDLTMKERRKTSSLRYQCRNCLEKLQSPTPPISGPLNLWLRRKMIKASVAGDAPVLLRRNQSWCGGLAQGGR